MGWPAGVILMLSPQSGSMFPERYHGGIEKGITDQDSKIEKYVDSCKILLEAGYRFSHRQIINNSSKILRSVFISELATRRRKLLEVSKAQINPSEFSDLRGEETGLPNSSASRIWASLMTKGHTIDLPLRPSDEGYLFCLDGHLEILVELYEAGFTDLDQTHPDGYTPLMAYCNELRFGWSALQCIAWLISKGANPLRELPDSKTTTMHLINQRLARLICFDYRRSLFDPHIELRPLQQIEFALLSTSPQDSCYCSCSVGGCTPLSVALRGVVNDLYRSTYHPEDGPSNFQLFLRTVIEYNQSKTEVCHAMIRILTFDGLGLNHTCCTELQYMNPWRHTRDEYDLQEIRDEQKNSVERFEKLVSEFRAQFDALELPLMDFFQEVWYKRMVKFLSERDIYDPEHHEETRRLGISLETDEVEIPLVVEFISKRVMVVEDDSEGL
ncbi:hypothetical protein N7466_006347 [Penicillium verhagenii]|uniref:uncharacterized protein n=1 Tax=Penicillium verhagenii TaxID=1562060 RepID=UPI00254579E6|nr:uncharacterized protein N7466_006347 [Penicillium verhagenii]KAJ5930854.1 hypothetical protein N7466_006347 [Penicillium verhagenii]